LFAEEYVKHKGNGTQAALQVYNSEDPKVAQTIASQNLLLPIVQETIDQIAAKQGITHSTILEEFKDLGTREVEKVSADTKLRSLVELAKMLRMYPSTKHTNINVSVKAKLKDMKYQDLKGYVEGMRSRNDELVQEVEELEAPVSTPPV
jgi:hypothetical protein